MSLMSWPPIQSDMPYSILMDLTGQTLPGEIEPRLHLSMGVRRWVNRRPYLSTSSRHGVYLSTDLPYLPGLSNSRQFTVAYLKRGRRTEADGSTSWGPMWDDRLHDVLKEAGCMSRLPGAQQVVESPLAYLDGDTSVAALVYSTGMLGSEPTTAGLSSFDRHELMRWCADTLAPELERVDPLGRSSTRVLSKIGAGRQEGPIAAEQLAAALGESKELNVELHVDSEVGTALLLRRLGERLGLEFPTPAWPEHFSFSKGVGSILVNVTRPDTVELRAALELDGSTARARDAASDARADRIEEELPRQRP